MKKDKQAFTLIELLVVVLIIGILAAVALPQYQKAVLKSRVMEVLPFVRAVYEAEKVYFLANGEYTKNMDELDIDVSCPSGWTCVIGQNVWTGGEPADMDKVEVYRTDTETLGVNFIYGKHAEFEDMLYCWGKETDPLAVSVCKSLGTELRIGDGFARYRIN